MKSSADLNDEYISLAEENMDLLRREYADMLSYSMHDASTVTEKSYIKTAYIPKIFRASDVDRLSADMDLLMGILKKVVKKCFEDASYRKLFCFTEKEEQLILNGHYERCLLPIARFDIFYNEDTGEYKFCELNTDGTSAMNEDRELNIGQKKFSSNYKKFESRYPIKTFELFDSWVEVVLKLYGKIRQTKEKPVVAIVDFMECATIKEFIVFEEAFKRNGIKAVICDVRELSYDGENLYDAKGNAIDVVYRRAVTTDVLNHLEESEALINAAKEDKVLLFGDFHTQIIHNKAMSVMLCAKETFDFLKDDEVTYLKAHFPYTKFYDRSEDMQTAITGHTKWVLKPADGYASKGIFAGIEYSYEEWEEIVPQIPSEHYIMQEYCEPYATLNYGQTEKDSFDKRLYNHLTGLFLYDGKLSGIYSRASIPKTFAKQEDEIALPTIVVEGL